MSYTRKALVWVFCHISSRDMGDTWRQGILELGLLLSLLPTRARPVYEERAGDSGSRAWQTLPGQG